MQKVSRTQMVYAMARDNAPAQRVQVDTDIVFETCDCFENQITGPDTPFSGVDWSRINPATGPVYVEGAEPGDVLAVEICRIQVGNQAVMATAPKLGVAGELLTEPTVHIVPVTDGVATLPGGVRWPIKPMIGVIGTAPAGEPVPCGTPDAHGGNMDNNTITEGAVLYLPVNVPGALLAMGDLHAAMGNGEVSGCGLEIAGEVTVRLSLIKGRALPTPMLRNATGLYTIASAKTLDEAADTAALNMAKFVCDHTSLSLSESISLLSICGSLEICQVVDPLKTCRFALPAAAAEQLGLSL